MLISHEEIRDIPSHHLHASLYYNSEVSYLWQHDLSLGEITDLSQLLSPLNSTSYLDQAQSEKRRIERLSIKLLLSQLLGHSVQLYHKEDGTPYLVGNDKLQISISHTKGIYALMLSTFPIGMDVERWSDKAWRIKDRFLFKEELQLLHTQLLSCFTHKDAATILWSAKEAAFKLWGCANLVVPQIKLSYDEKSHRLHGFVPGTDLKADIEIHHYPLCAETEAHFPTPNE